MSAVTDGSACTGGRRHDYVRFRTRCRRDVLGASLSAHDPHSGQPASQLTALLVAWSEEHRSRCSNTNQQPIQFRKEAQQLTMNLGRSCILATHFRKITASGFSSFRDHI